MTTRELQEKLVGQARAWQKIEDETILATGQIAAESGNPIVKLVMEIIQRDSGSHRQVQQLLVDSLEKEALRLTPEEMADVWGSIEVHIQREKRIAELAEETLALLAGRKMVVQQYLLEYLLEDERKHVAMLERLESVKGGMYLNG